jgi:hypothetical protein
MLARGGAMKKYIYLKRSSRKWVCFCKCPAKMAWATVPYYYEDSSPLGGSSYLWVCGNCGVAFSFAKAVESPTPYEQLAEEDTPRIQRVMNAKTGEIKTETNIRDAAEWVERMERLVVDCVPGKEYVFFDGKAIEAKPGPVAFQGLKRYHELPSLPHIEILKRRQTEEDVLENPKYWGLET